MIIWPVYFNGYVSGWANGLRPGNSFGFARRSPDDTEESELLERIVRRSSVQPGSMGASFQKREAAGSRGRFDTWQQVWARAMPFQEILSHRPSAPKRGAKRLKQTCIRWLTSVSSHQTPRNCHSAPCALACRSCVLACVSFFWPFAALEAVGFASEVQGRPLRCRAGVSQHDTLTRRLERPGLGKTLGRPEVFPWNPNGQRRPI